MQEKSVHVSGQISPGKKVAFYSVMLLIVALGVSAVYIAYTAYQSRLVYWQIKQNQRGWSGTVHRSDPILGFVSIPGSSGAELFPIGPGVPARYDSEGFRIPADDKDAPGDQRPLFLALGCSFTYGAATPAESTFPYLVGKRLGGSTRNAGICSYGLAQMTILAQDLIVAQKPDFVIAQYSTWLVNRAVNPFAPSYFGKLPSPYFYDSEPVRIAPPIFKTKVMELPIDKYRHTEKGMLDRLRFLWDVGLPLAIHDDFHMVVYYLKRALNLKPVPTSEKTKVIEHAYREIADATKDAGARLVIVVLGRNAETTDIPRDLFPPDAIVVDAQSALLAKLSEKTNEAYSKAYKHWRGNPPKVVDGHPNERAHNIIADEIVWHIRRAGEHVSNKRHTVSGPPGP